MVEISELLKKLNDDQIKPVLDSEGAVLVIAGAGSGKTRVLTTRIAYLIAQKHVSPAEICAITFTNKAAGEMKERLSKIVGNIGEMWVSTFHSMCVKILRNDADKIGYSRNFTIYDEQDKDKVLKRIIASLGYNSDIIKSVKNEISRAKNDCLNPDEYKAENRLFKNIEEIYNVYKQYEIELAHSNAFDFDDLLYKTYILFRERADVADYYSNKFRYVHIDEFQDTNKVQFALAKRLAQTHGNIFVVGDDDQSIYGWRGADIENILSFDTLYKNAKVYKLERNYRSTKNILNLANCIIKNNTGRHEKELWTDNGDGAKIEVKECANETYEAEYVITKIIELKRMHSEYNYKDFAVFMRLNALSRAFEQKCTEYGIPYRIFGGFRFYERKEIKDVLSYLKIINNTSDDESFLRSIVFPKRGIGETTLRELTEFATGQNSPIFDAIDKIDFTTISASAKKKIYNYKVMLEGFRNYSFEHSITDTIKYILAQTSFKEQFQDDTEENQSKLYNISELINSAEQFEKANAGATVADFLNSVTLSSDSDDIQNDDVITIATIHAVKGLEFKCVFVAGLDETILPIGRSFYDAEELEEERRLMYVAITRAQERLYLIRARDRFMYGKHEQMSPSRFLKEGNPILKIYTEKKVVPRQSYDDYGGYSSYSNNYNGYAPYRKESPKYDGYGRSNTDEVANLAEGSGGGFSSGYSKKVILGVKPKTVQVANSQSGSIRQGTKVRHPKFGEGTVIAVSGEGDGKLADVAFKGVGIKKLALKYAPLEII